MSFSKWMEANRYAPNFLSVRPFGGDDMYIVELNGIHVEIATFLAREGKIILQDLFYAASTDADEYKEMKATFKAGWAARGGSTARTLSGVVMEIIRHYAILELNFTDVPPPTVEDEWEGGTIMGNGKPMTSSDLKAYARRALKKPKLLTPDEYLCQEYIRRRNPEATMDNIAQHGFYGLWMKTTWVDIAAPFLDLTI